MGRLLIFIALFLLVAMVLIGVGYFAQHRADASKLGLRGSRRRIAELESSRTRQTAALKEIRDIATSSEIVSGDPLWSMVVDKVDQALEREDDK
jgi:hypothetical protein